MATVKEVLKDWPLSAGASEAALNSAAALLKHSLPSDYVQFLRERDGGEGFVGNNYLILWKAEELSDFNREYEVGVYAPGLLLFGSNGGGEGYGFDTRNVDMPVIRIPFIGMDLKYAMVVASSFNDLFTQLAK